MAMLATGCAGKVERAASTDDDRDENGTLGSGGAGGSASTEDGGVGGGSSTRAAQVRVGGWHTCALLENSTVTCWGASEGEYPPAFGQTEAPPGRFDSIAAGSMISCGIRPGNQLVCWGSPPPDIEPYVPVAGEFLQVDIATGEGAMCALRADASATCWSYDDEGLPEGTYVSIATSEPGLCVIRDDGVILCPSPIMSRLDGSYVQVVMTDSGPCGLTAAGAVECTTFGTEGPPSTPSPLPDEATYVSLSAQGEQLCGIRVDASVDCVIDPRPAGTYRDLDVGYYHQCGVHTDGSVECWARESLLPEQDYGQLDPPDYLR